MSQERPTLFLSNLPSAKSSGHHGSEQVYTAMVRPRPWEVTATAGRVPALTPPGPAFDRLRELVSEHKGNVPTEELVPYRCAIENALKGAELAPGTLTATPHFDDHGLGLVRRLVDGDTVICGCERWRPGKTRKHPCHLDLVAPQLVLAGWDVVLWGRRMTVALVGTKKLADGVVRSGIWYAGWVPATDNAGAVPAGYDPAELGWPDPPF